MNSSLRHGQYLIIAKVNDSSKPAEGPVFAGTNKEEALASQGLSHSKLQLCGADEEQHEGEQHQ